MEKKKVKSTSKSKILNKKSKNLDKTLNKKLKINTTKDVNKKLVLSKASEKLQTALKVKVKKSKAIGTKKLKANGTKATGAAKKNRKSSELSQKDLDGLKDLDPEFYDFLKKNDKKLLEFNVLDTDDSEGDEDEGEETQGKKSKKQSSADKSDDDNDEDGDDDNNDDEQIHRPNVNLEVASDESDFENEEENEQADGTQKVTLNLLRQWQLQLEQPNVPVDVLRKVVQAFNSALASISTESNEAGMAPTTLKVVGPAAFNGVIQLCVLHLQPAILRFLGVKTRSNMPLHKTKKWVKVRGCLRYYLTDLIRLIEQVSSPNILSVLLKHLHQMAGMIASFSALGKSILKRLIVLWATGDETVRVVAFLCILKITRNQQVSMLNHVLRAMYLSYVRNSKFVSPNTLPAINFMRRSLVEMFALDLNIAYQHAFLYIRQLAIHLRNAVILKKKDSFQAVYNWQFVNSLHLWVDLLGTTANKPQLQALIYPLVTITTGVIRLIPTAQYFPLRFHCLQALIKLCKQTNIFVPVLPLILEVLRSKTFNRKHTSVSMKPLQFTCILRLNKGQLAENGFRDEVIEQVFNLCLEYLAHESASLAFCDLVVPSMVALKAYIKECRNANYTRKLKQLLDKIQENARFIEQERSKITFGLQDTSQIQSWETKLRNKGTPLAIYYNSWVKTQDTKKRRQAAQAESINSDYDLPALKRRNTDSSTVARNENGEVELFPSDSEDEANNILAEEDENDEEEIGEKVNKKKTGKEKKSKQAKPKKKLNDAKPVEDEVDEGADEIDIVKELDLDDW